MKWFKWLFQRFSRVTGVGWNAKLLEAWQVNDTTAVIAALEKGADPNLLVPGVGNAEKDEPLLVAAARKGAVECIEALLHNGVDLERRASEMFSVTALGTALLNRKWEAARVLTLAGASWDSPMWVLDPSSLSQAVSLGALDPKLIKPMKTTIRKVATGQDTSLRDQVTSQTVLHKENGMRLLLAEMAAREKNSLLEASLVEEVTATRARRL